MTIKSKICNKFNNLSPLGAFLVCLALAGSAYGVVTAILYGADKAYEAFQTTDNTDGRIYKATQMRLVGESVENSYEVYVVENVFMIVGNRVGAYFITKTPERTTNPVLITAPLSYCTNPDADVMHELYIHSADGDIAVKKLFDKNSNKMSKVMADAICDMSRGQSTSSPALLEKKKNEIKYI